MGFQTSASLDILPNPKKWHTSKPQFYRTGHGGVSLFSRLSAIRGPQKGLLHQQLFNGDTFFLSETIIESLFYGFSGTFLMMMQN